VVGVEQDGERATFRFFLNPGMTWLWVGGAVMVLGGLLAVWPTRRRPAPPWPAVGPARRQEPAAVSRG
jgi:cytochrome c-type biogenesis protein CcmF